MLSFCPPYAQTHPGIAGVDGGRSPQELFAYIEDADLWRWRLPDSRCVHAAFGSLGLDLDANANPAIFDQLLQLQPAELIANVCARRDPGSQLQSGLMHRC